MRAIEKDNYYYDPPSWKVCPECEGAGKLYTASASYEGYARGVTCIECEGFGFLPIHYTPEQWKEAGGILTADTPVWLYAVQWVLTTYENNNRRQLIATGAGEPEEENYG